ncbi:MAG TPA: hypothetical protein VGK97_09170 [Spongiibacteraceae bacterium]|jgi:hypothetical protein
MDGLTQCPSRYKLLCNALAVVLAVAAVPAMASSLEQAKHIHDRLAGVPPSANVLLAMQTKIDSSNAIGAAYDAMNNPAFYNATLKNWAAPWTNRDDDKFAPLNDYSATVIGIVRDSVDYRKVLYGDIIYVGAPGVVSANYSNSDNNHYLQLEANDINLGDTTKLVQRTQSSVTGLTATATAGVITTRAAARAFFIDGTNRAMFRFTLKNHLCNDMEQVQETTRPTDRIRQDVSRSPGGDSRIFMNTCVGCHSGMDPMAQAFAFYNFKYDTAAADQDAAKEAGRLTYKDSETGTGLGGTEKKYHINFNHFVEGYVTPDDHWDNYWRSGPNTAIFGWGNSHVAATSAAHTTDGIYGDAGAKSMAEELANSEAFAVCSVKKVFKVVCLRDPAAADQSAFTTMLNNFKSGYDLKHTFAEAAVYCSGT